MKLLYAHPSQDREDFTVRRTVAVTLPTGDGREVDFTYALDRNDQPAWQAEIVNDPGSNPPPVYLVARQDTRMQDIPFAFAMDVANPHESHWGQA